MGIELDLFSKDSNSEDEISEESLRSALERLGARSNKRPVQTNFKKQPLDQRRRRFVQEGQVIVEHHQLSRNAQRTSTVPVEDHGEELTKLRNQLKREQRRGEDLQRELADLQVQHRTLETHLVHEKLHGTELKTRHIEVEQALADAQMQLLALRDEMASLKKRLETAPAPLSASVRKTRGPGRPPRCVVEKEAGSEPEPVRWWKD